MNAPKKYLLIAGGVAAVALLGVGGFFGYRYWVIREVKREAATLGVIITSVDSFHLTGDAIQLWPAISLPPNSGFAILTL